MAKNTIEVITEAGHKSSGRLVIRGTYATRHRTESYKTAITRAICKIFGDSAWLEDIDYSDDHGQYKYPRMREGYVYKKVGSNLINTGEYVYCECDKACW